MQVARHDDKFKHSPFTAFAESNGLDDHPRDVGSDQVVGMRRTIKPGFHFRKNTALNWKTAIFVVPRDFLQFGGNRVNPLLSLNGNRACQMNRDEVAPINYFPMWQAAAPECNGFKSARHRAHCSCRAEASNQYRTARGTH